MHGLWGREDLTNFRQDSDTSKFGFRKTLSQQFGEQVRWLGQGRAVREELTLEIGRTTWRLLPSFCWVAVRTKTMWWY